MNQASVDRRLQSAAEVLSEAYPSRLTSLFSPQHGPWGAQQANMIESPHDRHPVLGIPIHSLYSETRRPTPGMLDGLECLVVDLQDVGTRVYTFTWTVTYCLEACAEAGIPVVILDRPNPLGGNEVEGPRLDPRFASFVGRAAIPMRHGLTIAELSLYLNQAMQIDAEIEVVPMRGWSREMQFDDTGRPWIPPSPNLPTLQSVRLYPGQVLLEGTNLSEGRGTTTPFELVGAPFIDEFALASRLQEHGLPGVEFRPCRFRPGWDKWAGCDCGGVALHVVDVGEFRPCRTTLEVMATVKALWPDRFEWSQPPYEYETEKMPIDILSGSDQLRERLDAGSPASGIELDQLGECDAEDWWDCTSTWRVYPTM